MISEPNGNFAVVHCQNPKCDVTYEAELRIPNSLASLTGKTARRKLRGPRTTPT